LNQAVKLKSKPPVPLKLRPAYISFRRGRAAARGKGGQERPIVETRINKISCPGGATDSENDSARFENGSLAEDAAPDGAWKLFLSGFYKDVAPTARAAAM
jgi:hypothetical protein